jgi:hypothetical protein
MRNLFFILTILLFTTSSLDVSARCKVFVPGYGGDSKNVEKYYGKSKLVKESCRWTGPWYWPQRVCSSTRLAYGAGFESYKDDSGTNRSIASKGGEYNSKALNDLKTSLNNLPSHCKKTNGFYAKAHSTGGLLLGILKAKKDSSVSKKMYYYHAYGAPLIGNLLMENICFGGSGVQSKITSAGAWVAGKTCLPILTRSSGMTAFNRMTQGPHFYVATYYSNEIQYGVNPMLIGEAILKRINDGLPGAGGCSQGGSDSTVCANSANPSGLRGHYRTKNIKVSHLTMPGKM